MQMNELHFAYGVARIRCNEQNMLTPSDMEQLISAPNVKSAVSLLNGKGWELSETGDDYSESFARHSAAVWSLVRECVEDISVLNSLIVFNDFHNLKAALKCKFSGAEPQKLMLTPSVVEPDKVIAAVEEHKFGQLPEFMQAAAQEAYDLLVQTGNGQRMDCVLDVAAMNSACDMARESGSKMLYELAQTVADCADAKTALRSSRTGKDEYFISLAIAGCGKLDKNELVAAALAGDEEIAGVLTKGGYEGIARALEKGTTAFEKQCDDAVTQIILRAKSTAFGVEPIAAYYLANETEIKNVRIILSCKQNGLDAEQTGRRVRAQYV